MAVIGKPIRVVTGIPEPQLAPVFTPAKAPVIERELVPVAPKKETN